MFIFLILFLFISQIFCDADKIIHVHALWRHGERNPNMTFFGDLNDESAFPEGLRQLTKKGIHQLFTLGQKFQERYIKSYGLLSPKYQNSEVFAKSTDIDRTIASAMAFYSGLYSNPHDETHILAPVPIHTIPTSDDYLYFLTFKCPRLWEVQGYVDNSNLIKSFENESQSMLAETSEKAHVKKNFYKVFDVFDTAILEVAFGLPVPLWILPRIPEWNKFFVNYISALFGFLPFPDDSFTFDLQLEAAKVTGGTLISEIVDRLIHKIDCQKHDSSECKIINNQKFYSYSAHDITSVSLFKGLGFGTFVVEKIMLPDMGSAIVLELWENDVKNVSSKYENYYVKILYYKNATVEEPKNIGSLLPDCQGKGCPLGYLIQRADLLRPKPDLKTFCNTPIMSLGLRYDYSILTLLASMLPILKILI